MSEASVWFVTGSSRGLGREIVRAAIDGGHRVVATARDVGALREVVERAPDRVLALRLDIDSPEDVAAAAAAALDRFARIDVLVNNAGYSQLGAVEEIDEADARAQFDTNFFGPVRLIQRVLPSMRARRSGVIVNISSVGGFAALAGCGQYSAAKFAIEGMSEALALEVAPLGIRVIVVEPNGFRTDFVNPASAKVAARQIADYDGTRGATLARFAEIDGKQPSDPKRGAVAILEAAELPQPPFRLVLGPAGVKRVRQKLQAVEADLAGWYELSASVSFPPGE